MAKGQQDHGLIPVGAAIALAAIDQLLDLALGEVFPCSDLAVFQPARSDFPYFGRWGHYSEGWFCDGLSCSRCNDFPYLNPRAEVCKWWSRHFLDKGASESATTSSGACRLEAAGGLGWFEFSSPTAVAMSGRGRKRGPGGDRGKSSCWGESWGRLSDSPLAKHPR